MFNRKETYKMNKSLVYEAKEVKNGVEVLVEVPGYGKEDISVETKSGVELITNTFGFAYPELATVLTISAKNELRGESVLKISLGTDAEVSRYDLNEVEASTLNGILTIKIPIKTKFRERAIPVT